MISVAGRPPRLWWLLPAVTGLAVLLVAAIAMTLWLSRAEGDTPAVATTSSAPVMLLGSVAVPALAIVLANQMNDGDACDLGERFREELRVGAQVVITDPGGKTIGVGHLQRGKIEAAVCVLPFQATVPSGQGIYGVNVANRGVVQFPEARLIDRLRLEITKDGAVRVRS